MYTDVARVTVQSIFSFFDCTCPIYWAVDIRVRCVSMCAVDAVCMFLCVVEANSTICMGNTWMERSRICVRAEFRVWKTQNIRDRTCITVPCIESDPYLQRLLHIALQLSMHPLQPTNLNVVTTNVLIVIACCNIIPSSRATFCFWSNICSKQSGCILRASSRWFSLRCDWAALSGSLLFPRNGIEWQRMGCSFLPRQQKPIKEK